MKTSTGQICSRCRQSTLNSESWGMNALGELVKRISCQKCGYNCIVSINNKNEEERDTK